ncbi:MAG: ABC transporter substrate-binding protein [Nocardioidaceae bacterium]
MRVGTDQGEGPGTGRVRRLLAAALGGMLVLAALAAGTAPASADSDDTTLTAAMDTSGVDTLNPFLAYFNGATETFGLIYPMLNTLDKNGEPAPYLAESWKTSADKRTWTFKIRDGLKWSDGEPITAKDAAWTFNLIMNNDVAATANGSLVSNFASVEAPDDTTLVIRTKKPQSNMLYVSIPESGIPIVPEHIWKDHVDGLKSYRNDNLPVVGYGPWQLTEYKPEQYERFRANKDFRLGDHGAPKFDELVLKSFKNTDAAVAALRSGQISFLEGMNPTQYEAVKNDEGLEAYQAYGDGWTGVEINSGARTRSGKPIGTANPILADPKVRTAMHYAIDKDKLVSNVIAGLGVKGAGVMPPAYSQWFWTPPDDAKIGYDPDKAGSILDDAGYAKGADGIRVDPKSGKKLEFRLGIHSDEAQDAQISKYLQGWLKEIGIKLDIQSLSMTKLNDNLAKGDWDMLMDGWHTGPDPTYQLSIQTCAALPKDDGSAGYTDSFHCNPEYDKLFKQQQATFDDDQRQQIVEKMQGILYEDTSNIFLYYANTLGAVRKGGATNVVSGSQSSDGYYPVQTAFWHFLDATPPAAGDSTGGGSSNTAMYVGGGVVAVLVIVGGGIALRRRSTADERE